MQTSDLVAALATALALGGCGGNGAAPDAPDPGPMIDGGPGGVDAGIDGPSPDASPPGSTWLGRATSSSGFDHAEIEPRPDGFWLAGDLGCSGAGEVVHVGDETDPGRVAMTCASQHAGFVGRFTPDGRVVAVAPIETDDAILVVATALDGGGGLVVTGGFRGTTRFSAGAPDEIALTSRGAFDVFVAAYAADGALRWVAQAGGTDDELPSDVALLAGGTIAVAGNFEGAATFGAGAAAETLTSTGLVDLYVAGLTADGALAYAFAGSGPGNADARAIVALADGGFAIAGEFQSTLALAGATLVSAGENDVLVARFAPDRTLAWVRRAGAVDDFAFGDSATALVVGPDDSLVVGGYLTGPTTFGAGEANETELGNGVDIDMFLARYDHAGALVWAKDVDGQHGLDWIVPERLVVRGDHLLVWGQLSEHGVFGPGEPTQVTVTSHGNFDLFLAEYGFDGAFHAVRTGGGVEPDYAESLAFGSTGAYLVGSTRLTATLALWSDWAPAFTSTGLSDAFIAAVSDL